eukprot:5665900-Alexandrium_andersonii.AAC.1
MLGASCLKQCLITALKTCAIPPASFATSLDLLATTRNQASSLLRALAPSSIKEKYTTQTFRRLSAERALLGTTSSE